jgi:HAD superfamily hydrolase (TIGR01509 family)
LNPQLDRLDGIEAVVLDLDGVVPSIARLHAHAWKATFEPLLAAMGDAPFDAARDYARYIAGRPRRDAVRDFLAARAVPAAEARIARLASQKDARFLEQLELHKVDSAPGAVAFLRALRERGIRIAVVSPNRYCRAVLEVAGVAGLVDACVDLDEAARRGLAEKPAPDMLLSAVAKLGVAPQRAVVFESSVAGVEAARRGGFARVFGIDAAADGAALHAHGASRVIRDFGEFAPYQDARGKVGKRGEGG